MFKRLFSGFQRLFTDVNLIPLLLQLTMFIATLFFIQVLVDKQSTKILRMIPTEQYITRVKYIYMLDGGTNEFECEPRFDRALAEQDSVFARESMTEFMDSVEIKIITDCIQCRK